MSVRTKRVYENPEPSDGIRILVDRLWPRGISKSKAKVDEWPKDLAPSDELRRWFGHAPGRWMAFRRRYERELESSDAKELIRQFRLLARRKTVTLVFAARDADHCNARVLADVLTRK
jgi:uncharacterized protein YeaO (DUF488 family)